VDFPAEPLLENLLTAYAGGSIQTLDSALSFRGAALE
jgi:hypothetical protein